MMLKKYLTGLLAIGASSMSLLAYADLRMTNNTKLDSTAIMNHGDCSNKILGDDLGVTKANSSRTMSNMALYMGCVNNHENCQADIYMSRNCTGPIVATVILSTTQGIKSVTLFSNDYQESHTAWSATLNGGPGSAINNWFM